MQALTLPQDARKEERIGLGVALALHLVLVLAFIIQPSRGEVMPLPERMTVSLASDVGLKDTAPVPVQESRAAIAEELADAVNAPAPQQQPNVASVNPDRDTQTSAVRTPEPEAPQTPPQRSSGSRIGDNFLTGAGDSTASDDGRIPASQIGASAQASLKQAISRQIKPHWNAPSGLEAEQLITILAFRLNEDGTLAGRPRVVRQAGITAANRPQANLHAERAIRAVQLAAPFDLPPEFYNAWKNVSEWRFDRRL